MLGAHLKALSHYYAALVHMTIVRQLKNSEKKDCKSNTIIFLMPIYYLPCWSLHAKAPNACNQFILIWHAIILCTINVVHFITGLFQSVIFEFFEEHDFHNDKTLWNAHYYKNYCMCVSTEVNLQNIVYQLFYFCVSI